MSTNNDSLEGISKGKGLRRMEERMERAIKPKGFPIAFRFFPKGAELDEEMMKSEVQIPVALCQVIKAVNINGTPQLIRKANKQECADGEHVLGFYEHPKGLGESWEIVFGIERERYDRLVAEIIHAPFGANESIIFAPLHAFEDMEMQPQGVIFNVNITQAELLILSSYLANGKKLSWSYNGHAACEIVAALEQGKSPWLVFPCLGTRFFAADQEDELWFGLSIPDMEKCIRVLEQNGMRYPLSFEAVLAPTVRDFIVSKMMKRPE
jgi:uncharacterized protein (DUF169 family)